CRRHGIGYEPPVPAGRYEHPPGKEMQHDTSPHHAHVGGRERPVQIAGLALAHSRLSFVQLYPQFTRFECKVFLDDALDSAGELLVLGISKLFTGSGKPVARGASVPEHFARADPIAPRLGSRPAGTGETSAPVPTGHHGGRADWQQTP